MEEILASIRRIIADDDAAKPQAKASKASEPGPKIVAAAPPPPPARNEPMGQDDIDAMLAAADEDEEVDNEPEPDSSADVLDLTEEMAAPQPAPKSPTLRKVEAPQVVSVFEPPPAPAPPPRTVVAPPASSESSDPPLLSPMATAAVNSAFGTLAHTMLVQNAKTLEDLVKEMLRPMLKVWLDDNLPTLVERLVRAEIERVSRGHP